jgi:hypothetical protein
MGGDPDQVGVAQVADHIVSGPASAPGGGSPVAGTESVQYGDEPLPLFAEHVEQVLRVKVALAPGPQDQLAGPYGGARNIGWPVGRG